MKNILFAIVSIAITVISAQVQQESNVWVMGDSLGLDFSTNPPTSFNSKMYAQEACASVSDGEGNLLFYTNGVDVYNRNYEVMPNGFNIGGDIHASQCLIVPQPSSDSIFYIFIHELQGGTMRYSDVNLSLDGGLGNITSKKA